MIQRYEPFNSLCDYTGEYDADMRKNNFGDYVRYDAHMREVTRLQERIAELQEDRDGHSYGDV